MKKQLLIFSILVVMISVFVSCSTNSGSEEVSTTAVKDSNGTTHYYVPVTDDNGNVSTIDKRQSIFVEIETQSNGKAVTKKDGTYVTNEHTIVLPIKNPRKIKSASDNVSSIAKNTIDADNHITFETSTQKEHQSKTTTILNTTMSNNNSNKKDDQTSNTELATKITTNKDGWIDKWY